MSVRRNELLLELPQNPFERATCGSSVVITRIRFRLFVGAILLLVLAVLQNYIAAEGIAIQWDREEIYPIYFEYLVRVAEGVEGAYF